MGENQRQCQVVAMSQLTLMSGLLFNFLSWPIGATNTCEVARLWHVSTSWLSSVHTSMARHLPVGQYQKWVPLCESAPRAVARLAVRASTSSL